MQNAADCRPNELRLARATRPRKGATIQTTIELPKAFSVRDAAEFRFVQDLLTRLNPKLLVAPVATGMHVDGGATVNWGLVYLDGQPPTHNEGRAALEQAGLNFQHNVETQASRIWADDDQSEGIKRTPA